MKVIGITGGVGSGKSALLAYISEKYNCRVILADEIAHKVKEPGQEAYSRLVDLLSTDILKEDGAIHRGRMAAKIFGSESVLEKVNEIIHPAVKDEILRQISQFRCEKKTDFLFIEAALLIEGGYLEIVDEMWYIFAREDIRRKRLKETRNYTDEKIDAIMKSQLKEDEFRKKCSTVIDNSESLSLALRQIDEKLGEYL